jgi:predicted Zn-dependent protease
MPRADLERGDTFHDLLKGYVVFDDSGWAHEIVHRVGGRLQADVAAGERLEPEVVWLEEVTAFTLPGRHVYFTRGLLQRGLSEDAVAFVFAHELAHHRLGHVRGWFADVPGAWLLGVLVRAAHFAFVSPEKEADADRWALERCVAAGYDRRRCLELFTALERAALDGGNVDGVFGGEDPEQLAEERLRQLDGEEPAKLAAFLDEARRWAWKRGNGYASLRERRAALEHVGETKPQTGGRRSVPLLDKWREYKSTR